MHIEKLYEIYLNSNGVSTDSRSVEANQLFFALSGPNFNGNKFAKSAIEEGAMFAIIDDDSYEESDIYILVNDVLQTLQLLAQYHRDQFDIPVLAITGSNGKTTTKELIASVLSQQFSVHYTIGNLNNHIGVPLTLLALPKDSEIAIIEMGANHLGEIKKLCEIAKPTMGLITNISGAHLEGFGSIEGVKKAKSELYQFLSTHNGEIFLNAEDEVLNSVLPCNLKNHKYSFGNTLNATLNLLSIYPYLILQYNAPPNSKRISSKLYGEYNSINISAALAIGEYFDLSVDQLIAGIESYCPQNNRSEFIKWKERTLILDAYNANPTSMRLSIAHFANTGEAEKILILGDMAELGDKSQKEHEKMVEFIAQWEWSDVFLIGKQFCNIFQDSYHNFESTGELLDYLTNHALPIKSAVLLKGSRVIQLENLLPILKQ